jgi:DNA gyrase inhibitor GyrI
VARLPEFTAWFGRAPDRALDIMAYDSWPSFESDSLWVCEEWRGSGSAPLVAAMTFSIPLTVQGTSLGDVAAGLHDSSFLVVASSMVANGWGKAVIRLGWEFNGSWMPWAAGQDLVGYVAAFRHVVALMRSVPGSSFTIDWCCAWGPAQTPPDSVYPGDDVIDIIGMDIYSRYYDAADAVPAHAWQTYLTSIYGLNWLVGFAQSHGKPISIPEWGTGEWLVDDGGTGGGDNPLFVSNMAAFLKANNTAYSDYWDYADSVYDSRVSNGEHPNSGAALVAAFGVPTAPASVALPGPVPPLSQGGPSSESSVSISFAAPLSGAPASAYVIDYRVTGQAGWTTSSTVTWIGWQTLNGLLPGTSYDVQVYATNAVGSGPASAPFTVQTLGAAPSPTPTPDPTPTPKPPASTVQIPGQIPPMGPGGAPTANSVSISFAAPFSGGPPSTYVIEYRMTGQSGWTPSSTVTWIGWQTLNGLSPGTSYDVEVYATNSGGSGLPSAPFTTSTTGQSPTPTPTPSEMAPGPIPAIGPGGGTTATSVSISFVAPYVGGTPSAYIILYRITGRPAWTTYGTVTWIGWQTLYGLSPGTSYDVEVYATNAGGSGLPSSIYTLATNAL